MTLSVANLGTEDHVGQGDRQPHVSQTEISLCAEVRIAVAGSDEQVPVEAGLARFAGAIGQQLEIGSLRRSGKRKAALELAGVVKTFSTGANV